MLLDESNLAVHSQEFGEPVTVARVDPESNRMQPEARTFGIPTVIWGSMAASYIVFFMGLALGTGHDGKALFLIAISVLYTLMYFGTAFILNSLGMADRKRRKNQWVDGKFDTFTGPMTFGSVYGQMLVVPIMFALFGVAIAIIRFLVF